MPTTLAHRDTACPNQTNVRPSRAPTDRAVAEFELFFETLHAVENDDEALDQIYHGLEQIRALTVRMENLALARIRRIRSAITPELHRLSQAADINLNNATRARRVAKHAVTHAAAAKALEALA